MCGIAGLIRPIGLEPQDHLNAAKLRSLLRHRGPDGAGVVTFATAAFVQTRLALVDLNPHPLPLRSVSGRYTLCFNGEIYNHRQLRRELERSHPFRTCTDTEVALNALMEWGPEALSRFEGIFALCLWDEEERTALLAVDPLSVKPLLYHSSDTQFLFCSEAGPLITSGALPFRPNEEAIAEHLAAPYFSGSHSLPFANLQRLLPGHYLQLNGTQTRYRTNSRRTTLMPALRHAVQSQFTADAKVGLFLSGGVDSSLLAALAPAPVDAYTIDYDHTPGDFRDSLIVKSDDLPFARRVAAQFDHQHHIVTTSSFAGALARTLNTNDLISAWEQEVSQNLLAEAAAKQVKAVLVGDAADETHYGYSFLLHPERLASPRLLIDYFGQAPAKINAGHFVDKYRKFAEGQGQNWHTPNDQRLAITSLIRHFWLTRLLHNGDIHLMAHSVEGRVPFSDTAVTAIGDNTPVADALREGIEKHHLRAAAAEVLPHEIAWRPKSALTKHLAARAIIHEKFREAWRSYRDLVEPYVLPAAVDALQPPESDRESGIRFRLLALMTWFARFSNA